MFRMPTVGEIELSGLDACGNVLWTERKKNTMTYAGVDLLAGMLAWSGARINTAYVEFKSDDSEYAGAVEPADSTYYAKLTGADYLRLPIVIQPRVESTDEDHFSGNRAVFEVMTAGGTGVRNSVLDSTSYVYGLALVCAPDSGDDIVFARTYFTPRQMHGTHQLVLRWAHTVGSVQEPT